MKFPIISAAALAFTASPLLAGGIERSNQSVGVIFEPGRYAELSFGRVLPSVDGVDLAPATVGGPFETGDVADNYWQLGAAFKTDLTEQLSMALIIDQPFGADIEYPAFAGGAGSLLLGGTAATVDSTHLTALARYRMPSGFGVHGGIKMARASGELTLSGEAFTRRDPATGAVLSSVSGYNVDLDSDIAFGWVAGVSYERPEIAARVALTYNSEIEHEFDTVETLTPTLSFLTGGAVPAGVGAPTGTTTVTTPRSWNLDFQTGVAPGTLVFGSIRWVDWSSFKVAPPIYGAALGSLTEIDDTTTYTLGVGRRFSDAWSGAASISWEKAGDDLVSPLAPTNGRTGISLAAIYSQGTMKITTGINYTRLGNAQPETGTPDQARATFEDNSALGIGVKVGFTF